MMLAPINATDKVYSITPSAMSVGVVSSLPGFRLGSGVTLGVQSLTAYGTTAKVFGRNSGSGDFTEPLFETVASGRDVVVTTWARLGTIFLRCDKDKGRGLKIQWTGNTSSGEMKIAHAVNVPSTSSAFIPADGIGETVLFQTNNLSSYLTGWNTSSTAGDQFEFSLIGLVLTVKWNGQAIYKAEDIWFTNAGTVLYCPTISDAAIRDTTITFKASTQTYTDFDNRVIDLRDWGWKDLKTTGSMGAASTTLTVASSAGFAVGDPIIIELGGEAGAGLVGTIGVGGTWPATRVANYAALPDASTYRAANGGSDCWIWVISENAVYINYSNAGVPTWGEWTNYVQSDVVRNRGLFHTTQLRPRALKAKIVAISGNTITLDTASEAATSNVNVYYDCSDVHEKFVAGRWGRAAYGFRDATMFDPWTYRFQPGTFCITKDQSIPLADYWNFKGSGRGSTLFYSPKGTEQVAFKMSGESVVISDFKVQGWAGINYWCTDSPNGYIDQQKYAVQNTYLYKSNCVIERVDLENTWGGPSMNNRFDSVVRDCKGVQSNGGIQQYATWFFGASYCTRFFVEDCEYYGPVINPAFEIFQCTDSGFRRIKSKQGYVASNTSGGFLFENIDIDVDFRYKPTANDWVVEGNPVVNINNNIVDSGGALDPGLVGTGGTIRNPRIKVHNNDISKVQPGAIVIQSACPYILVEGTHPEKPGHGYIEMSDFTGLGVPDQYGNNNEHGAIGVMSTGHFTTVRGLRVVGLAQGGDYANITLIGDAVVENCVANTVLKGGVSQVGTNGNITNAQYEALP